jgi:hypothetical protein
VDEEREHDRVEPQPRERAHEEGERLFVLQLNETLLMIELNFKGPGGGVIQFLMMIILFNKYKFCIKDLD